jgi:high-affinity iron transporter
MLPALLITFREVLEAALIVATILGILTKLGHHQSIKTVWTATISALLVSVLLLAGGSLLGLKIQELFEAQEALFEGIVMIISAFFITWAVFFLHKTFGHYKLQLLQQVRQTMELNQKRGIFLLVFTAVFREGFEIILFLSTMFFSSRPIDILNGFILGAMIATIIAILLFKTTIKLPVFYAFRITSLLLILFAAGLLAHGYHELTEAGVISEIGFLPTLTFSFLPEKTSVLGSTIRAVFGLAKQMHTVEFILWSGYTLIMTWIVFLKPSLKKQ